MPSSLSGLSQSFLVEFFHSLGIKPGSRLVVHSSMRSLGPVDGGADTVIGALLEVLGIHGLLIVPTFTYNNPLFDPKLTPSRTGVFTEVLRLREGAVRSLHPTHSVAALGEGADELCRDHHQRPGLGIDSPLDRAAKAGGGVLLLGIGHAHNSTVHVGEAYAGVPYLDIPYRPERPASIPVMGPSRMEVTPLEPPGCSLAFGVVESSLRRKTAIRDGLIGDNGLIQWMPGEDIIDCTVELLKQDAAALLCTDPGCYRCSRAREKVGHLHST